MTELISVIINVYNCIDYLPTSLGSVREQTYNNLEVILVDDCSTDGSGEYCDKFCKQDERFRVIHHEKNTGVSGPRNTGLNHAHGEYVYFMDGDDYIHSEMIERLHSAIYETGIGLAVCDYVRTDALDNDIHCPIQDYKCELIPIEQVVFGMLSRVELKWCVSWNKLFRRSLIDGLVFNDYYSIQDQDFNIRVYQRLERLVFIPAPLYYYYENPKSLQRDASLNAKRFHLNTIYRFRMLDYLSKKGREKAFRAWVIGFGYLQMLTRIVILHGTAEETDYLRDCNAIIHDTKREFIFTRNFPFKKKARFLLSWYYPRVYGIYEKKLINDGRRR